MCSVREPWGEDDHPGGRYDFLIGPGVVCVTGTDTGVGKTIVTAALAAVATARGRHVIVVKPAQTGLPDRTDPTAHIGSPSGVGGQGGAESDAEMVARLADVRAVELVRYPDPLAPLAAARTSGRPALALDDTVTAIRALSARTDLVLVEGAGGLLVPMGEGCWTLADLAVRLGARCVVVARAGLGTLNHTALTMEALARREIPARVIIGAWPERPELAHYTNLADLRPLAGVVPDGAGLLTPERFRLRAASWLHG